MVEDDDTFKSYHKYGLKGVTVLSSDDNKNVDPVGGISGTFRKLNCD